VADFVYNRSLGRVTQFVELILGNAAPYANAALIVSLWNMTQSDAINKDLDDIAAVEASGSNAELTSGTNANYVRKTLIETGSSLTVTYDDTNDRVDIDFADQTWTALGAGTNITDVVVAFDNDTTGGTDANILPCTQHDFVASPDGSDLTMVLPAAGFYRAQ
jgi:hypothetical protein